MKKEVADKLVNALRSGKYEQGTGQLRVVNQKDGSCQYCCLGVLSELYRQENEETAKWGGACNEYFISNDGSNCELMIAHPLVTEWAGMTDGNPHLPTSVEDANGGTASTIAEMNDGGLPFDKIADYIEQHFARL